MFPKVSPFIPETVNMKPNTKKTLTRATTSPVLGFISSGRIFYSIQVGSCWLAREHSLLKTPAAPREWGESECPPSLCNSCPGPLPCAEECVGFPRPRCALGVGRGSFFPSRAEPSRAVGPRSSASGASLPGTAPRHGALGAGAEDGLRRSRDRGAARRPRYITCTARSARKPTRTRGRGRGSHRGEPTAEGAAGLIRPVPAAPFPEQSGRTPEIGAQLALMDRPSLATSSGSAGAVPHRLQWPVGVMRTQTRPRRPPCLHLAAPWSEWTPHLVSPRTEHPALPAPGGSNPTAFPWSSSSAPC